MPAGIAHLRQHASLFLLLLAFALKGLIPHGYMPGAGGLVVCPGGGPMSVVAAKTHSTHGHMQALAHTQTQAAHAHAGHASKDNFSKDIGHTVAALADSHAPAGQTASGASHQDHHAPGTTVEAHTPCVFASADASAADSTPALPSPSFAEHIYTDRTLVAVLFNSTRPPLPARGPPHPRRLSQTLKHLA